MYRNLLTLLVCAGAVLAAPQKNSNITYVKRQLDLEFSQPELKLTDRESRIEKVPLTIPGNVDKEPKENSSENLGSTKAASTTSQPTYNYSDRIYSIKTKPKKNNTSTENTILNEDVVDSESKNDTVSETKDSDIIPAESTLNDRVAIVDDADVNSESDSTQSDEFVTEKYEEESTVTTEVVEDTTRAPTSRPLPKLSYFEKSTFGSFSQNLIANSGKRRFRSRCRCEKIWNCAKLQISVPRCPEEYFMCCS